MYYLGRILLIFSFLQILLLGDSENRIPFYEDYLKKGDLNGFLKVAERFLRENPDSVEGPRLAFDFLLVAKAAQDINAIDFATSLLLFNFPNSLPTVHLLSSFDKRSPALLKLLKDKVDASDMENNEFAMNFCRTFLLIAKIQGPEILNDSGLRLRSFLMAKKAGVQSIIENSKKGLILESKGKGSNAKISSIILSDSGPMEKLVQLSDLSGSEVKFCISFYLSELTEKERNSEQVKTIKIKQALFGGERKSVLAQEIIDSLPASTRSSPKYQLLLAHAKYLNDQPEQCILGLKKIPQNSEWGKTARLYANGLEFSENRKKLLLEAIDKAINKLEESGDTLFLEASWKKSSKLNNSVNFKLFLGISSPRESFEIQLYSNQELKFAYRTDNEKSSVFSNASGKILDFETRGAIPTPKVTILRDPESGNFNYSFNLNFSPSFESLLKEVQSILKNSYIATTTGREVIFSHLLTQKAIWLGVPESISGGTKFPILSLQPDYPEPIRSSLVFDLLGNLSSFEIDGIKVTGLKNGNQNLLSELPEWPSLKTESLEKFDFKLLMNHISDAMALGVE